MAPASFWRSLSPLKAPHLKPLKPRRTASRAAACTFSGVSAPTSQWLA